MTDRSATALLHLLERAAALKTLRRSGWLDRGIGPEQAESVADHTFGVCLLAWLAARDSGLDGDRVLQLALIHDLPEAAIGDWTPYDPDELPAGAGDRRAFLERRLERPADRAAAKRAAEASAMTDLLTDLPEALRAELAALWSELEAGSTAEARFVKQADKLETWFQSRRYRRQRPDLAVASFAAEVAAVIDHPALVRLRDAAAADGGDGPRRDGGAS